MESLKPIAFDGSQGGSEGADLPPFPRDFLPPALLARRQAILGRLGTEQSQLKAPFSAANAETKVVLDRIAALNLPPGGGVPDALWGRVFACAQMGGYNELLRRKTVRAFLKPAPSLLSLPSLNALPPTADTPFGAAAAGGCGQDARLPGRCARRAGAGQCSVRELCVPRNGLHAPPPPFFLRP